MLIQKYFVVTKMWCVGTFKISFWKSRFVRILPKLSHLSDEWFKNGLENFIFNPPWFSNCVQDLKMSVETFFEAIKLSKNFNGVKTHPIVWDVRKSAELCRALLLAAVSMLFFSLHSYWQMVKRVANCAWGMTTYLLFDLGKM